MKLFTHLKVNSIHQDYIIINDNPGTFINAYPPFVIDLKSITKFYLHRFKINFIIPPVSIAWAIKYPNIFLAHVKNYKGVFARGSPGPILSLISL